MGQPYWTREEEDYFANVIIPLSDHCTGTHLNGSGEKFGALAPRMQRRMQAIGINKRTYTEQNLFQHWYQRYSARATGRNQQASQQVHTLFLPNSVFRSDANQDAQPLTVATKPSASRASDNATPPSRRQTPQYNSPLQQRRTGAMLSPYVDQFTQTKWTIEPGVNTDGHEANHEDGMVHPSNIGYIYHAPLFPVHSSTSPASYGRHANTSPLTRPSAYNRSQAYSGDEEDDELPAAPFYDPSPAKKTPNSAARPRAKATPKNASKPSVASLPGEMDIDNSPMSSVKDGQKIRAPKRIISNTESASKRRKASILASSLGTFASITPNQSRGEAVAADGPKVATEKPRGSGLTMEEALRQVMMGSRAGQTSSQLPSSSPQPRRQESTFAQALLGDEGLFASSSTLPASASCRTGVSSQQESAYEGHTTTRTQMSSKKATSTHSPTGSVASVISISSTAQSRPSTPAASHVRQDSRPSPDATWSAEATSGNFRARASGPGYPPTRPGDNRSYQYTPERLDSRASPSTFPPTRLGVNQSTFEESPGYSFYSPTGSSYCSPAGSHHATPGRRLYTQTPEPRNPSPLKTVSGVDEYAVEPNSPSTGRGRNKAGSQATAPPAPLFDGTPSRTSTEPLPPFKPIVKKKSLKDYFEKQKSRAKKSATPDGGEVQASAGISPAVESLAPVESPAPRESIPILDLFHQVEPEPETEVTTDKHSL
jgi:hypothetical protein